MINGSPILINEQNSIFRVAEFLTQKSTFFPSASRLKRTIIRCLPSLSGNFRARKNLANFARLLLADRKKPLVLVIGGSVVGSGAEEFLSNPDIEFVETDVALSERVGLICDGHDLPFASDSFDGVIVQAVLEHVVDPIHCVKEIHRITKMGGLVYAETPFCQQVHGRQYDFTRFTYLGHRRLFRNFVQIDAGACCGPGMALAWSYQYFLLSFARRPLSRLALIIFARFTAFWLKYLDLLMMDEPAALDAASGYYFVGRKSDLTLADRDLLAEYPARP